MSTFLYELVFYCYLLFVNRDVKTLFVITVLHSRNAWQNDDITRLWLVLRACLNLFVVFYVNTFAFLKTKDRDNKVRDTIQFHVKKNTNKKHFR